MDNSGQTPRFPAAPRRKALLGIQPVRLQDGAGLPFQLGQGDVVGQELLGLRVTALPQSLSA